MKNYILGVGLILGGCIGIALGNLEETIYYTSEVGCVARDFQQGAAYYMFWAFLLIGFAAMISESLKKKKKEK